MMSDNSTISELLAWRLLTLVIILMVTAGTAKAVKGHHFITGIILCGAMISAVTLTIFPMWALVFAIGAILGGLIAERSPSV